jgi:hypothetical protein
MKFFLLGAHPNNCAIYRHLWVHVSFRDIPTRDRLVNQEETEMFGTHMVQISKCCMYTWCCLYAIRVQCD